MADAPVRISQTLVEAIISQPPVPVRETKVLVEAVLSNVAVPVRETKTLIEVLVSIHTFLGFKVDTVLLKTIKPTFSVDSSLLFRNSKTYQTDAHFNPIRVWNVNSILKKTQSTTYLVDNFIVHRLSISHNVDTITVPTRTHSVDAVLKKYIQIWFNIQSVFKKTEINLYSVDAIYVNRHSISYSVDSLLYSPSVKTFSSDALILSHTKLNSFVDADFLKTEVHYYQIDAQLKKQTIVQIDSVLEKTEIEAYLVDSLLKATFRKIYLIDASLPNRTIVNSNVDSHLFKGIATKIDSHIIKRQHINHGIDCRLESLVGADVIATASSEGRKVSQQIEVRIEELQMKARSVKIVSYLLY